MPGEWLPTMTCPVRNLWFITTPFFHPHWVSGSVESTFHWILTTLWVRYIITYLIPEIFKAQRSWITCSGSPRQQARVSGFYPRQLCSRVRTFDYYTTLTASFGNRWRAWSRVCLFVFNIYFWCSIIRLEKLLDLRRGAILIFFCEWILFTAIYLPHSFRSYLYLLFLLNL